MVRMGQNGHSSYVTNLSKRTYACQERPTLGELNLEEQFAGDGTFVTNWVTSHLKGLASQERHLIFYLPINYLYSLPQSHSYFCIKGAEQHLERVQSIEHQDLH